MLFRSKEAFLVIAELMKAVPLVQQRLKITLYTYKNKNYVPF